MRKDQVVLGVPVSESTLLTDDPHFWGDIKAGMISDFTEADTEHPATQWLVRLRGINYLIPNKKTAMAFFEGGVDHE